MTTTVSRLILVPDAARPVGQLPPQAWREAPETSAVIEALSADGTEVRFVGGCVRDALAHRDVTDVDIATPDPPETVIELLERAAIRAIPTGLEHGTVSAVIDGKRFEITTLRKDVETDGRHAKVVFTDDWVEDAKRRDFTINAMSATPDGDVYDPFDGIADLAHGRIRFVGLASERIEEDYLRILRFFRFFGAYGRPPMDADAKAACRKNADKLTTLSGERVRDELMKIMMTPDPADMVIRMRGQGVLDVVLPEAGDVSRLRLLNWLETRAVNIEGVDPDAIRHLAVLLDRNGAVAVAERLRLSNDDAARLADLTAPPMSVSADMGELAEMRAIRHMGAVRVRDLALLAWARELSEASRLPRPRTEAYMALLERCAQWAAPAFPLKGADVLALGVPQGPGVGKLLETVEDWWENGGYQASRQQCLDRLMKVMER